MATISGVYTTFSTFRIGAIIIIIMQCNNVTRGFMYTYMIWLSPEISLILTFGREGRPRAVQGHFEAGRLVKLAVSVVESGRNEGLGAFAPHSLLQEQNYLFN